MPRRTQISRADLLECLHAYGEAYLEDMAAALGYERDEKNREARPVKMQPASSLNSPLSRGVQQG